MQIRIAANVCGVREEVEGYYQAMKRACGAMESWQQPDRVHTITMLELSAACVLPGIGQHEEGRAWMRRALASAAQLFWEERRYIASHYGGVALRTARTAGWTEEGAVWREVLRGPGSA